MIERFIEQYRWLSNFWEVEIEYEGVVYPSVEHYYVAIKINEPQKFTIIEIGEDGKPRPKIISFDTQEAREFVSRLATAGKAKGLGRDEINIRKDWDDIKVSVMEYGLRQKYSQEPFMTKLIETGDEHIQEGNTWKDVFWGVNVDTGEGKNVLGKLIMKIRDDINNG